MDGGAPAKRPVLGKKGGAKPKASPKSTPRREKTPPKRRKSKRAGGSAGEESTSPTDDASWATPWAEPGGEQSKGEDDAALSSARSSNDGLEAWTATPRGGFTNVQSATPPQSKSAPALPTVSEEGQGADAAAAPTQSSHEVALREMVKEGKVDEAALREMEAKLQSEVEGQMKQVGDQIARAMRKAMHEQIAATAEKETLTEADADWLASLLSELRDRMNNLTPSRADLHAELQSGLDVDLARQVSVPLSSASHFPLTSLSPSPHLPLPPDAAARRR